MALNIAVEVVVNGGLLSAITAEGSIAVKNSGARRSASLEFSDLAGTWVPSRNADILVRIVNPDAEEFLCDDVSGDEGTCDGTWQNEVLFGGRIRKYSLDLLGAMPIEYTGSFSGDEATGDEEVCDPIAGTYYPRRVAVDCSDYASDLDKRYADTTYTSKTLAFIVDNLNDTYLSDLGYTVTYVSTGPTIAAFDLSDFVTIREAFDRLATISGYVWWVDESRNIWFREPSELSAPFYVSDDSLYFTTVEPSFTDELYRNVQHVRLEDGTIVTRTDTAEVALYGEVENLVEPRGITTTAAAEAYGDGLLRRYAHALSSATVVTGQHRCRPGQTMPVYLPSLGISRTMIIDSVDAKVNFDQFDDGVVLPNVEYTVSLSEYGDRPQDFIDYMRELLRK